MSANTVEKAKRVLGMKLDAELAQWFGVNAAAVYNWKRKGVLPPRRWHELHYFQTTGKKPAQVRA